AGAAGSLSEARLGQAMPRRAPPSREPACRPERAAIGNGLARLPKLSGVAPQHQHAEQEGQCDTADDRAGDAAANCENLFHAAPPPEHVLAFRPGGQVHRAALALTCIRLAPVIATSSCRGLPSEA